MDELAKLITQGIIYPADDGWYFSLTINDEVEIFGVYPSAQFAYEEYCSEVGIEFDNVASDSFGLLID